MSPKCGRFGLAGQTLLLPALMLVLGLALGGGAGAAEPASEAAQIRHALTLSRSEPSTALKMIEAALAGFDGAEDPALRVEAATAHIWALQRSGENASAVAAVAQAESSLPLKDAPPSTLAEFEAAAGWVKSSAGQSGAAFSHYQAAHRLWSELDDEKNLARLFTYMGTLYKNAGDHERAGEYYASAWETLKDSPEDYGFALVLVNWAYSLIQSGQAKEALSLLDHADAATLMNRRVRAYALENRGAALVQLGDMEAAAKALKEASEIAREMNLPHVLASVNGSLAQIELDRGAYASAARYGQLKLEANEALGQIVELRDAHALMSRIREAQGDTTAALEHLRQHILHDQGISSQQARNFGAIADAELELVTRQQEIEELKLAQETSQKLLARGRLIAIVTVGAAVIICAVLVVLSFMYRAQRRAKALADERARQLSISEEKANAASRSKSEFLASISHEIRTPLNGVIGMTQALALDDLSPRQREKVDVILDSGDMLTSLLNDVLDLSKIEAGKLEITRIEGNLRRDLERLQTLWTARAREKRIELALEIDASLPARLSFDPVRVRQCILNLVSNAVKFTERGRVDIRASATTSDDIQRITIEVRDTGIGMSEATLAQLFSPFSQADASTTRKYGGTGLGLTIARKLARLMSGDIAVDSKLGEGSRFVFTFEAQACAASGAGADAAGEAPAPAAAGDLAGRKVLIADDLAVNRQVVRLLLASLHAAVAEAENGVQVIEALEREAFDLILLDAHMPVMDGLEAIRRIRAADKPWKDIPVIALTADAMTGDRERYLAAGMTGYASKPVDYRELTAQIHLVLSGRPPARGSGSASPLVAATG